MTEYAIIGGGIAGASTAYHLSERTDDAVTVFEQGELLNETTAKSFALFGYYGGDVQYGMKEYAMELYNQFMANPRGNPRYHRVGRLDLAVTTEEADRLKALASGLADDDPNVSSEAENTLVEYLSPEEIHRSLAVPLLDESAVEGALHRPKVGYFSPTDIAQEFVDRARENGVEFREHTAVTDVVTENSRVTGLVTDAGTVSVDQVVCAAGPWNIPLARNVGIEIPVKHTLAPVLKLQPSRPLPHTPACIAEPETGYGFRGSVPDGSVLLGNKPGGWEDATEYDPGDVGDTVPDDLREGAWDAVDRLLPGLSDASVVDEWVGVRSATPDDNPIVGKTAVEGFSLIAFSTSGIQLSPAAGYVVAEQLVNGNPTDYYDDLSISRFDGHDD